jgi:hypothetical protein
LTWPGSYNYAFGVTSLDLFSALTLNPETANLNALNPENAIPYIVKLHFQTPETKKPKH